MKCLLALTNGNLIFINDVEVTYKEYTGHRSNGKFVPPAGLHNYEDLPLIHGDVINGLSILG
jgi:hypothetical protein